MRSEHQPAAGSKAPRQGCSEEHEKYPDEREAQRGCTGMPTKHQRIASGCPQRMESGPLQSRQLALQQTHFPGPIANGFLRATECLGNVSHRSASTEQRSQLFALVLRPPLRIIRSISQPRHRRADSQFFMLSHPRSIRRALMSAMGRKLSRQVWVESGRRAANVVNG